MVTTVTLSEMVRKAFYVADSMHFDPTRPVADEDSKSVVLLESLDDLIRHVHQPEVRLIDAEESEIVPGRFRHPETHEMYRVLLSERGGMPLLTKS